MLIESCLKIQVEEKAGIKRTYWTSFVFLIFWGTVWMTVLWDMGVTCTRQERVFYLSVCERWQAGRGELNKMKKLFVTCWGSRITGCTTSADAKYFLFFSSPSPTCHRSTYLTLQGVSDLLKAGPKLAPKIMKYSKQNLALAEGLKLVSSYPLAPAWSRGNALLCCATSRSVAWRAKSLKIRFLAMEIQKLS